MKQTLLAILVTLLMVGVLDTRPAQAVMDGLDIGELTRNSDTVIQGRVESLTPRWSEDGQTILTTATVRVGAVEKGNSNYRGKVGRVITVEYEGGEIGNIGYRRADVAVLAVDDEVFMFLKAQRPATGARTLMQTKSAAQPKLADMPHAIVGLGQGVYKIDEEGVAQKNEFSIVSGHEKVKTSLQLDELRALVREVR